MTVSMLKPGVSLAKGEYAKVAALPTCNICQYVGLPAGATEPQEAHYDGRTHTGQWAFMCPDHFTTHAVSAHPSIGLGTGKGQELIVVKS